MDIVDPKIAVILSGYDSQYGHPHDEVLQRFDEMGIETYWTGVHSDVVVTTDGTNITVESAEAFSTDPAGLITAKPTATQGSSLAIAPATIDGVAAPVVG